MRSKDTKKHDVGTSPVLLLPWDILAEIIETIGRHKAESGGMLAGPEDSEDVSHFQFDKSSSNSAVTYTPDNTALNKLLKDDWNPKGIRLRGFIHSHPGSMGRPSCGDEIYAERILKAIDDLACLWLPIINTLPDTDRFQLIPWVAYRKKNGVSVVRAKVRITDVPAKGSLIINGQKALEAIMADEDLDRIVIGNKKSVINHTSTRRKNSKRQVTALPDKAKPNNNQSSNHAPTHFNTRNTFNRVQKAYSLPLLRRSRIIAVGAGGAAEWLEQLARCGVGQFVLIDPDTVSETNLATQQTYRRDIGRPKVDCIAERIRDINPSAKVLALKKSLDDITDEEVRALAKDPIDGRIARRAVLCGLTDNFFAQARVNRLALHLGLPSLNAQLYKEGRGAEITFTYPGITPACHRCIASSRYTHYLDKGLGNDVTSHGTPIFATARLNATKGYLILAILHHKSSHPRWGKMLTQIANRNLVQIRMDPDFTETMNLSVFDRVFAQADQKRLFFDEAVWLPQKQECPETGYPICPDCGGTGDLTNAIGKFEDTRITPVRNNSEQQENSTKQHTINAYI